jgi:hypothetical protein
MKVKHVATSVPKKRSKSVGKASKNVYDDSVLFIFWSFLNEIALFLLH